VDARPYTDRRENEAIQLRLVYDYRTNPPLYPVWQTYLREHQPPTLVVWGDGDETFGVDGATAYADDVETVEIHCLDTGHFALAEAGETIATLTRTFLGRHLVDGRAEAA
jgi:pimeloyl-ACP methyl ester carboxylesterase